MLSCLLRKRLNLCKLKQLRSVPISSDWRLPAHRPVSTSIGLPLLWDRFPPSPARQGVPQSSQPLKQGRTMAGSLQHSQVAQKVLELQSTDEGLSHPQRRQRCCECSGEILQVSGHVPSQCWVPVLLLKPRLENPLLLIIFSIVRNVRELIRVETARGFEAYTEISCRAHKFTVLNSLHTAGHVHFCLFH